MLNNPRYKKGDLLATIDKDLAVKVNEVAYRIINCEDRRLFNSKHGLQRRSSAATYRQALYAAEGIIGMSRKEEPFADLTMLSYNKIKIEFANSAD
jgi:hypothetical protein